MRKFRYVCRVEHHLDGGVTDLIVLDMSGREPVGRRQVTTALIPPHLRNHSTRIVVEGVHPDPDASPEDIREALRSDLVTEFRD